MEGHGQEHNSSPIAVLTPMSTGWGIAWLAGPGNSDAGTPAHLPCGASPMGWPAIWWHRDCGSPLPVFCQPAPPVGSRNRVLAALAPARPEIFSRPGKTSWPGRPPGVRAPPSWRFPP